LSSGRRLNAARAGGAAGGRLLTIRRRRDAPLRQRAAAQGLPHDMTFLSRAARGVEIRSMESANVRSVRRNAL
jgi:hypothetical protein